MLVAAARRTDAMRKQVVLLNSNNMIDNANGLVLVYTTLSGNVFDLCLHTGLYRSILSLRYYRPFRGCRK